MIRKIGLIILGLSFFIFALGGGIDYPGVLVVSSIECFHISLFLFFIGFGMILNLEETDYIFARKMSLATTTISINFWFIYRIVEINWYSNFIGILGALSTVFSGFFIICTLIWHSEEKNKEIITKIIKEKLEEFQKDLSNNLKIEIDVSSFSEATVIMTIGMSIGKGVGTIMARKTDQSEKWKSLSEQVRSTTVTEDWKVGFFLPLAVNEGLPNSSMEGTYQREGISLSEIIEIKNSLEKGGNERKRILKKYFGYKKGDIAKDFENIAKTPEKRPKSRLDILLERMEEENKTIQERIE